METQSLVTIVPWTFIATILNLFLTMLLVKKFLFKPINRILEQRQALSEKELTQARAARAQLGDMHFDAVYASPLQRHRPRQIRPSGMQSSRLQESGPVRKQISHRKRKKPSTKPRMRSADLPWTSQERSLKRRSGKRIIRS